MNTAELNEAEIRFGYPQLTMQPPQTSYDASAEELPMVTAWSMDSELPDPQTDISPEQAKQLRVLLVEDDADTADRLALLLRMWGHSCQICQNGSEVLEVAAAYQPHVVLLDIGLPEMEGFQVARRLRERSNLKKAVLISITGFGDKAHRRRAKEEGFDNNLIKAVDPHQLEDLLLKIVGGSREHAAFLESPDQFDSFHRKNDFFTEGIHTVFGVKDGTAQPLAFYFPADHFTPSEARKWLQERGLEPLVFTEAMKSEEMSTVERSEVLLSAS